LIKSNKASGAALLVISFITIARKIIWCVQWVSTCIMRALIILLTEAVMSKRSPGTRQLIAITVLYVVYAISKKVIA
jgi:hypothetical protein